MTFAPEAHKTAGVLATFTVDDLAQEIRRVDGKHGLGAGALAEALMPFLSTPSVPAVAELSGDGLALPAASGAASELLGTLDAVAKGKMPEELRQKLGRAVASLIYEAGWDRLSEDDQGDSMRAAEAVLLTLHAALDIPPSGDDPKALDAEARAIELGKDKEEEKGSVVQVMCGECQGLGCGCCDYDGYFSHSAAPDPGEHEGDDTEALDAAARYVRHKKRGTTYRVIGVGKMQAENWHEQADELARYPVDMAEVVTYQCLEDGALWVRPVAEFEDGRFEEVPAPERFAAARSSSTEAVEQERSTGHFAIDHDGFAGTVIGHYMTLEGKQGVVLQQDGTRVVHVYGEKWLKPSPVPAACKPEGETHG